MKVWNIDTKPGSLTYVARWFVEKNPFLRYDKFGNKENHLKIEKLLHYANVLMLLIYGRKLYEEETVAYKQGFVVEKLYNAFRINPSCIYCEPLEGNIDEEEERVLNLTNILFGKLSGEELSNIVHMDDIWRKYEESANIIGSRAVLQDEDIVKYYRNQRAFIENLHYCKENYDSLKKQMDNIIVEKIYKQDNVFFYYDKDTIK